VQGAAGIPSRGYPVHHLGIVDCLFHLFGAFQVEFRLVHGDISLL
jgi:hypothetical protein